MTALLDLNVLLDLLLQRSPWDTDAEAIWDANLDGRIWAMTSAASIPTIFYLIRKQADLARAHLAVGNCLAALEIVPVDRATLEMAARGPGSDFEDNVQVASAVLGRADAIITRDPKGFAGSPVAVLSPAEFLARLTGADPPDVGHPA